MKNLFSIIIIGMCLFSCSKERHCPNFPEELESFIPYELNDTIRFDTGYDTIEFIIFNYRKYDKEIISRNCDCDCGAYIEIEASYQDTILFYRINSSDYWKEIDFYLSFGVKSGINASNIIDTIPYKDQYGIYDQCVILNDNKNSIVVAKNYGIIRAFLDNGETWTLIE